MSPFGPGGGSKVEIFPIRLSKYIGEILPLEKTTSAEIV